MIDEEEIKFIFKAVKRISKEYGSYKCFKIRSKNYLIKKGYDSIKSWGAFEWKEFVIISLWYSILDSKNAQNTRLVASIAVLEFYKILDEKFPSLVTLFRNALNSEFSYISTILSSNTRLIKKANDEINVKLRELYSYFASRYESIPDITCYF